MTTSYQGEKICLRYRTGICKHCDSEVATDSEYYIKKEQYKSEIDKRLKGIITLSQTNEILRKYNIGKEALSIVAGFGKVTVKRYYEGVMPCSANSEILMSFLNDESFFLDCVEKHKSKLTNLDLYLPVYPIYGNIKAASHPFGKTLVSLKVPL